MDRRLPPPRRLKCRPPCVGAPLPAKRPPGLTEQLARSCRRHTARIIVNERLRELCSPQSALRVRRNDPSFAIYLRRIEQPVGIDERQSRAALARGDLAVEAG